jgi:hypothetical protein
MLKVYCDMCLKFIKPTDSDYRINVHKRKSKIADKHLIVCSDCYKKNIEKNLKSVAEFHKKCGTN